MFPRKKKKSPREELNEPKEKKEQIRSPRALMGYSARNGQRPILVLHFPASVHPLAR